LGKFWQDFTNKIEVKRAKICGKPYYALSLLVKREIYSKPYFIMALSKEGCQGQGVEKNKNLS